MSIKDLEVNQAPIELQQLKARMIIVEQGLISDTPGIVNAMIDIHKNLQEHEELVQFLSDEDIHLLHLAHEKHKQVVLIQKQTKAAKKKPDFKNLRAEDL